MSLITASHLGKSYGATDIFSGVNLSIPKKARVAIVGPNGIGKTTLLRLLIGLEEPSEGNIQRSRNLTIGYLPQEAMLHGTHTVWQECLAAIPNLLELEGVLTRLEAEMSDPSLAAEALEHYGSLQQTFEQQGGYVYETRIRHTLTGLGFDREDFHRPITQLSGGQRTRALLARLLLSDPDLLVLDEPTNHLDIQAVEWLEGYLRQWEGSALIVSHDRYFLDQVVDHIWEMSVNGLELYRGNYSAYLKQRQERWALRQQSFETEKERLEKELDYIRRNIAGQNTLQAKGRLKRLSRTLDAIEKGGFQAIENKKWSEISDETGASSQMMTVDEANHRVSSLRNPLGRPPQLSLNLQTRRRSGDLVLRTYGLKVGYADEGHPLFQAPDLVLKRGECAALIGPNGAGKTTFLKTLLGMLPPFEGQVVLGASLDVAYFAQAHEDLQPERTLIEEIESVAPHMLERQIRDLLARFLFTNDEVYRKVATLSGGERGRLALAKLSLTSANLLLLDEPTNHLDIPSQEILQEVLGQYPGTILLVSHDRYLIDALATQIWEVQPGGFPSHLLGTGVPPVRHTAGMTPAVQPGGFMPPVRHTAGMTPAVQPGGVGPLVRNVAGMTPAVQPGGVGSPVRNAAGMTPAVQLGGVVPPVRHTAGMTPAVQPDQTGMRVFEGTYSQYQASLAAQITRPSPSRPKPDETHRDLQKRLANRDKRRQQRLAELEGQITHLEKRLAFLTQQLENPPTQPEQVERLGIEYVETQEEINTLVAEWESLQ